MYPDHIFLTHSCGKDCQIHYGGIRKCIQTKSSLPTVVKDYLFIWETLPHCYTFCIAGNNIYDLLFTSLDC